VIVLNASSTLNGPSGVDVASATAGIAGASGPGSNSGSIGSIGGVGSTNVDSQKTIAGSGTAVYSLKGQILDISFLDTNGALVCHNISRDSWTSGGGVISISGDREISAVAEDEELNNLDIDFSYLASSNLSNSIASNFFGGPGNAASTNTNSNNNNNNNNGSDVNNNNSAANNQYDDSIFGAPPVAPSSASSVAGANAGFMNTFNPATFGQSFDETAAKSSNKTNKSLNTSSYIIKSINKTLTIFF
jgi:hypothetical protein